MDYQDEYNEMMKKGPKDQHKFRYLIVAVVAFVIGFGLAWLSFRSQNVKVAEVPDTETKKENKVEVPEVSMEGETSEEESTPPVSLSGPVSLSVLNQAPGKTVFVNEVSAPRAVWVVVVEDTGGVHGNILGAGLFDVGETAGLVELLRGTVEGGSYYAVLHNEDSNLAQDRMFDLEKDIPVFDSAGEIIEVKFNTSSIPGE